MVMDSIKMLANHYQPFCDFCGQECCLAWFRFQKDPKVPEMNLCELCYSNDRYPSFIEANEFEKVDILQHIQKEKKENTSFTMEETSKLLDLV
jgi:Fe-S-cluster-containing hydrogenase component 2